MRSAAAMSMAWGLVCLCVCAALVAGHEFASSELTSMRTVEIEAGRNLLTEVRTNNDSVYGCYLQTPKGELIQFLPEDLSDDKYQLENSIPLLGCRVTIKDTAHNDTGIWELYYTSEDAPRDKKASQYYNLFVKDAIVEDIQENNDSSPIMLPIIDHGTRLGSNITITLSKKEYLEECYIQTPENNKIKLEDALISGVQAYPTSTNFVSCRVVIGPMQQSMLGTWILCGKHTEGETTYERCQPASIEWATNNPADDWFSNTENNFDHPVNYGLSLSPTVRGSGSIRTCHVITPEGEDIALTASSDYPGLQRIVFQRDTTVCGVTFGPINAYFLGNWVLYGTFNSHTLNFNVATQPMTLFIYDEENPYSQAYNVTTLRMESHVLNEGLTQTVQVFGSGTRQSCEVVTNTGLTYDQDSIAQLEGVTFVNNNNVVCRLQVGPITSGMFGNWQLIGKFRRNNVLFNEFRLPFRLLEEDPSNPFPDDFERSIEYLKAKEEYASFGESHIFSITADSRMTTDSCHLRTPDNLQYILRHGLVRPEFKTVQQANIACGVQVNVNDESVIGKWTLIARVRVQDSRIERRLPFTIHVEEEVNAVPNVTTVAEGSDLYMRLENATLLYDTCMLRGPTRNDADRDDNFADTCGFIVRDVTLADAGLWVIEYGTRKKYKALIFVKVTGRFESLENVPSLWTRDAPLNETIGPVDTVYCTVEDPSGLIVFQGFGRCRIVLDQVTEAHEGVWRATIATVGRVHADVHEFVVTLSKPKAKAQVTTSVVNKEPSVTLSCQIKSEVEISACKFRDPSGRVLLASQGVGEGRYSFHVLNESTQSKTNIRECGLLITNPEASDLGFWRCGVETRQDTFYGFLTVLAPWAMQDPAIAEAVVSEPTLIPETESLKAVEGNAVTLRCSVQSAIRYCYFRAENGTVFNVGPGSSEWFTYAGAGLDSGECSIKFPGLQAGDSGSWSCHVGYPEHLRPEQQAQINVHVDALMVAEQILVDSNTLVVRGQVHRRRALEYCRFVRIDGQGFTSDEVPRGYEDHSLLANGKCEIIIRHPSILEQHPWMVVAKIVNFRSELARSTQHTLTEEESPEVEEEKEMEHHRYRGSKIILMWSCVLATSMILVIIGLLLGPKRNREWTHRRATGIRDSFRRSLMKKPLQVNNGTPMQTSPTAA